MARLSAAGCCAAILVAGLTNICFVSARADDCLNSLVAVNPDLSKLPGGGAYAEALKTDYGKVRLREIRYDFSEGRYLGKTTTRITETVALDFSDVLSGIKDDAYNQTSKAQTCNQVMHPENFSLDPQANGNLEGGLSVDTTFRLCQIFKRPCLKDGYKVTMCREEWKEDIGSHVFGVNIGLERIFYSELEKQAAYTSSINELNNSKPNLDKITDPGEKQAAIDTWNLAVDAKATTLICANPALKGRAHNDGDLQYVTLCGKSEFDSRGFDIRNPFPNVLLNLVGVATLNIGSKFVLDKYRHAMSDAQTMINQAFANNLPSRREIFGNDQAGQNLENGMIINAEKTRFAKNISGNGPAYVAFNSVSEQPTDKGSLKSVFCRVTRPVIAQYIALLNSTTKGDETVTIQDRESLWTLAESRYGSGYYFVTLLPANNIALKDSSHVSPGMTINIPAMYKIWNGEKRKVNIGDSMWSIAKGELGSGKLYADIYDKNKKFIRSPDVIYPLQLLQMKPR